MLELKWLLVLAFQMLIITNIEGSIGDKSQFYNLCFEKCLDSNCDRGMYIIYLDYNKLKNVSSNEIII